MDCPQCVIGNHRRCWAIRLGAACGCDCRDEVAPLHKRPTKLRVECGHCDREYFLPAEDATVVVDIVMDSYYELRFTCPHCGGHNGGPLPAEIGRHLVDATQVRVAMNEGGYA